MENRVPPKNEEAERSALGAAMLDENALYEVVGAVKGDDFYNKNHKEIFDAIFELYKKNAPVDSLTVCDELKKRGSLDMVGGRAYVASLSSDVPLTSNAGEYARIVAEKADLRRLIIAADDIAAKSYAEGVEADEMLDYAEQQIFDIAQGKQSKNVVGLNDILLDSMEKISERAKNKGEIIGVPTGFIDLDNMTTGLQKSDLIILAARPSMGKTAFALCAARNAAAKGNKVLIFSLEMAKEQLTQRFISMEAMVDAQKIRKGDLVAEDWKEMSKAADDLNNMSIFIDDTVSISITEMKNKSRRLKEQSGLDLIIIDYMQLMNLGGKVESRQQEMATISRMLKQMAREVDCPVIALSQLSRNPEGRGKSDHRPVLADLRDSGAIEQDADVVMFLYRDEVYNDQTENPGECEVIVGKQRNGPVGTVYVRWLDKYTKFVNKSQR